MFRLVEPVNFEYLVPHCAGRTKPFNYILKVLYGGMQWKELPIDKGADGLAEIHYTGVFKLFARWCEEGSLERAFIASVRHLDEHKKLDLSVLHGDGSNTVAKKGGEGIGYSGHKHQTGEKVIAIADNRGNVLASLTVAPVNQTDMVLLPEGLKDLKHVAREADLKLAGAVLNLDAGFDSKTNRKAVFNAGMKPNIKENPGIGKSRDADANDPLMRYCTNSGSPLSVPLLGKTSSNGCSYVLRLSRFDILGSN